MVTENDDYEDVARWLRDAAARGTGSTTRARTGNPAQRTESAETVLEHLEQLTGRSFHSREAIDSYLKELAADEARRTRAAAHVRIFRETVFLGLLLAAYLHYHYWEVTLQIASLAHVQVFVPVIEHRDGNRTNRRTT